MQLVVLIAAMALFAVALYGFGWAARRCFSMPAGLWPVTLVLGLAAMVFVGGILNLLRLAYMPALLCVVAIGLAFAAIAWRGRWTAFRNELRATFAAPSWTGTSIAIAIVCILGFVVATALPPAAYNVADDYPKYFFHPLRMLAYGTLFGAPASALGSETLGGKAFIDGFVAAFFPLKCLNASDAVLGLFLCLALAARIGVARAGQGIASLLAVLAVFFIDPQWINISALYLGAALIMGAVALTADRTENESISAPALGLVYAALVAMKTTFLLFVALHGMLVAIALAVQTKSAKEAFRFAALTALAFVVFLAPWIGLHAPHYATALLHPSALPDFGAGPPDMVSFITISVLPYGSTPAQYTLLVLLGLATGLAALERRAELSAVMTAAAAVTAFLSYVVLFLVFGPLLSGYAESIRYAVPFLVGIVPAVFALSGSDEIAVPAGAFRRNLPWIAAGLSLLVFLPSLLFRLSVNADGGQRPAFAFSRTPLYDRIDARAWAPGMQQKIGTLQRMVPAGAPLAIWANAPYFLDLGRNPVQDIDSAGLASPWAALPSSGYVIWEYGGFAMPMVKTGDVEHSAVVGVHERLIAARELQYSGELAKRAMAGTILYKDREFALIHLPATQ
jgi:hypothetical protein